jgi:hypothetical protein
VVSSTGIKQIHAREGSPCPSSASHRPIIQRCGVREKGSHNEQEPSTSQDASTILNEEQVIKMDQQGLQNALTTQEKESQVMQEEHNTLNDRIGVSLLFNYFLMIVVLFI